MNIIYVVTVIDQLLKTTGIILCLTNNLSLNIEMMKC